MVMRCMGFYGVDMFDGFYGVDGVGALDGFDALGMLEGDCVSPFSKEFLCLCGEVLFYVNLFCYCFDIIMLRKAPLVCFVHYINAFTGHLCLDFLISMFAAMIFLH